MFACALKNQESLCVVQFHSSFNGEARTFWVISQSILFDSIIPILQFVPERNDLNCIVFSSTSTFVAYNTSLCVLPFFLAFFHNLTACLFYAHAFSTASFHQGCCVNPLCLIGALTLLRLILLMVSSPLLSYWKVFSLSISLPDYPLLNSITQE